MILPHANLLEGIVETQGSNHPNILHSGEFELDVQRSELRQAGKAPLQVLVVLAGRPGELVTREEIQQQLWKRNTFVDFEQG